MFKKYMSVLALSALISTVVADDCCDVQGCVKKEEPKSEVANAVCPAGTCEQMQDENCCKTEAAKTRVVKGSKVLFKIHRGADEVEVVEAVVPHNMVIQLAVDDAAVNMVLSTVDEARVELKAATACMDPVTKNMMSQAEVAQELALGEQASIMLKDGDNKLSVDVCVMEACEVTVTEQAAQ